MATKDASPSSMTLPQTSPSHPLPPAIVPPPSEVSQHSMFEPRIPRDLSWKSISMKIPKKKILDTVWGEVKHGETLAVMGPSGRESFCSFQT
jgi:ABC-type transport system involved in cytochrome bd biosynthesis fused ATPase/permease subunit